MKEEKDVQNKAPEAPLLFPCPPSRGMSTVSPQLSDRCEIFPPNTNIFSDFSCRIYTWDSEQTTVTADSFFYHLFLQLPFNSLTNRFAPCEERLCRPHKMIFCKKRHTLLPLLQVLSNTVWRTDLKFYYHFTFKKNPPWMRCFFCEDLFLFEHFLVFV